ncbi:MAG: glycosyltransferase [Coleofasciculus chthonoplastes F3-SA18-01]|uniref:glycosyltransferase n=1 Tax=Coleofasciculus chthonoplastes TaxID=64178 RepID=UPI003301725E
MRHNVCITTLEYPPDVGGVGESAQRIAQMLKDLGYKVHVAVFRAVFRTEREKALAGEYRRSSCQTTEQNGIMVHRLKPAIRSTSAKEQDYLCDIYSQLKQLHQIHRFDIFHGFFINETGFLTTLLARENNLPVINSVRGADLHKHSFSPQQHGQITWTLDNSSWVTFVSQDLMNRARVLVPSIQEKSSAFLNAIAPINFDQFTTPALVEQFRGTVIGSVGNFRDKKGLEYLLDACAELAQETELTLLLVGDFVQKERGYWEQELRRSGIANQVLITGKISRQDALAYLPYLDIFAIPSLHDGCPNALLEAMLAGRAIVGTTVDAIGEILENRIDALLVNPASSQELTLAFRELIHQPSLRQQLGIAAQSKVKTQLTPSGEQQNWNWVYQQVLKQQEIPAMARVRLV